MASASWPKRSAASFSSWMVWARNSSTESMSIFLRSKIQLEPGRLFLAQLGDQFQRGRHQGVDAVPDLFAPRLAVALQQALQAAPAVPVELDQAQAQRLRPVRQGLRHAPQMHLHTGQ